jgi:hypothetical protein
VAVRCTANISVAPVTWSAGKILLNYLCRPLDRFLRASACCSAAYPSCVSLRESNHDCRLLLRRPGFTTL